MDAKFAMKGFDSNIVYVKQVDIVDLPDEVRAEAGDLTKLFSVHNAQGAQLALVANRQLAFHLARENNLRPVTVH